MTISNSFSLGCPETVAYLCGQPTTKWEFQVLKPAQHENPPKLHLICIHKQLGVARNEYIYFAKIYAEHLLKGTSHKLCSKIISCTLSLYFTIPLCYSSQCTQSIIMRISMQMTMNYYGIVFICTNCCPNSIKNALSGCLAGRSKCRSNCTRLSLSPSLNWTTWTTLNSQAPLATHNFADLFLVFLCCCFFSPIAVVAVCGRRSLWEFILHPFALWTFCNLFCFVYWGQFCAEPPIVDQ